MDTVLLENSNVVFSDVGLQVTTNYQPISKGKHKVVMISKTKTRIESLIDIPSNGSGKRTIQVDGIRQVSILED
jgi:hypothetical protein